MDDGWAAAALRPFVPENGVWVRISLHTHNEKEINQRQHLCRRRVLFYYLLF